MSRSPSQLTVNVPSEGADRPSWVKVGVIAVVGFAVGVVWPRLAGIRPGPSAPGESASASARAPEVPGAGAPAALASASPAAATAAGAPSAGASGEAPVPMNNAPPAVLVAHGNVVSCKTTEGESLKGAEKCGTLPQFDGLAMPRLKKLAYCPQAHGASGKLSVVFSLDFTRNKINFVFGKSSTIDNRDSIDQCLRESLLNVSLNAVAHDNPLYAVFYNVTFTPRDSAAAAGAASAEMEPSGPQTAQVGWEVAIVRDAPRTGAVVARLQRGTKVRVATMQDGWYRVKYGSDFGSEGWLYRGAIGK